MDIKPCPSCGSSDVESCPEGERADGRKADMGIRCPNCGERIDFHAGHIDKGNVFVCEKGKPLMREVRYHCRHCDSTVIFLKKYEQKEVDHD